MRARIDYMIADVVNLCPIERTALDVAVVNNVETCRRVEEC